MISTLNLNDILGRCALIIKNIIRYTESIKTHRIKLKINIWRHRGGKIIVATALRLQANYMITISPSVINEPPITQKKSTVRRSSTVMPLILYTSRKTDLSLDGLIKLIFSLHRPQLFPRVLEPSSSHLTTINSYLTA